MITDPLLLVVLSMLGEARRRIRAVTRDDRGALTLEWIVLVGILVAAAIAAGAWMVLKITAWEGKVGS